MAELKVRIEPKLNWARIQEITIGDKVEKKKNNLTGMNRRTDAKGQSEIVVKKPSR